MLPPITQFKRVALNLFFPPWCINCGREGKYLCDICLRQLPFISPPVCSICGRPLTVDNTCPGCIGPQAKIDVIRAPFLFGGAIRQAVHELKYNNLKAIAPLLASFLHDYLLENPLRTDVIVPVPIHQKRYRERGYNQSALIARELGKISRIPVVEDCLIRKINTPPQVRTTGALERWQNMANAFVCADRRLADKRVLLIDDVSTSGATLNACASALKDAGTATVCGLTLALEI